MINLNNKKDSVFTKKTVNAPGRLLFWTKVLGIELRWLRDGDFLFWATSKHREIFRFLLTGSGSGPELKVLNPRDTRKLGILIPRIRDIVEISGFSSPEYAIFLISSWFEIFRLNETCFWSDILSVVKGTWYYLTLNAWKRRPKRGDSYLVYLQTVSFEIILNVGECLRCGWRPVAPPLSFRTRHYQFIPHPKHTSRADRIRD